MRFSAACLDCIQKQICKFCDLAGVKGEIAKKLDSQTASHLQRFKNFQNLDSEKLDSQILDSQNSTFQNLNSQNLPPPAIAQGIYENLSRTLNISDPYAKIKAHSIQKAHEILQKIPQPQDLAQALRICALGNIIDYGSQSDFDFERDFDLSADFARFDIDDFENLLDSENLNSQTLTFQNLTSQKSESNKLDSQNLSFQNLNSENSLQKNAPKKLLFIADNAGENLFDEVLIKFLKQNYANLHITYFVRDNPIINDITLQDLQNPLCAGIFKLAEVKSSGAKTPGFIYENAIDSIKNIFDSADIILAKGMGNYECLENLKRENLFLLFKVKCDVVAAHAKIARGKMVFMRNF